MDFSLILLYNGRMISLFALFLIVMALSFPTLMLTITYPLSKKWALFWSNYITTRSDRLFFAILRYYRGFRFLGDKSKFDSLPEQFLVISNHQSLIDIVVYLLYFSGREVRFVSKDSLNKVPMVGKMLRSQGHCMIPRKGSPSVAMKHLEKFGRRVVERKQVPVLFPEGTRSTDGSLRSFYSAGFRMLIQSARIPVAVCALDGGWKMATVSSVFRCLKTGAYRVKVLKVYDAPQTKEEEKLILDESRVLIQKQLDEWRKLPPDSLEV